MIFFSSQHLAEHAESVYRAQLKVHNCKAPQFKSRAVRGEDAPKGRDKSDWRRKPWKDEFLQLAVAVTPPAKL